MTTQLIERTPAPASTIGFGNLMHSEWTKLRSVRSTYWTVIAAALSTVALAVVICIRFRQLIGQDGPGGFSEPRAREIELLERGQARRQRRHVVLPLAQRLGQ